MANPDYQQYTIPVPQPADAAQSPANDANVALSNYQGVLNVGNSSNSFHFDPAQGLWLGASAFSSAPFNVNMAGNFFAGNSSSTYIQWDGTTLTIVGLLSSVGERQVSTCFETAARFGLGGNNPTFGQTGVTIATTGSAGTSSTLDWIVVPTNSGSVASGSPVISFSLGSFNSANPGTAFVGIGSIASATTANHIGFKVVITGGVTSLYATQGDGSTENASSALTTMANGDTLDLIFKVNGSASATYYWRKNGGALSSPTTLTANMPALSSFTTSLRMETFNGSNANVVSVVSSSASYSR